MPKNTTARDSEDAAPASRGSHLDARDLFRRVQSLLGVLEFLLENLLGFGTRAVLRFVRVTRRLLQSALLLLPWVDIDFVIPGTTCTVLHDAAEEGSERMVRALIAVGADVNRASICEKGYTPLIMAAQGGSEPVAQALIDAGADVNKADKSGVTPIRAAAQNGHEAVIRALIAAGAVEDEATKILRHRNAMQQVLQGLSGRSLPEMPTAEGMHGFDPRTGQWVNLGTGEDAFKAFLKTPKDRSGGRE